MAGPGANPFLMMEEDYSSHSNNLNPFLMDSSFTATGTSTENPFLIETNVTTTAPTTNATTNPFAFDSNEFAAPATTTNIFADVTQNHNSVQETTDFFSIGNGNDSMLMNDTIQPQKPDALNLTNTHNEPKVVEDAINLYSSDEELKAPPKRPPPPRPIVPPSKETQDLIMSVTGAMDATSSHLLDKLPPTRTPSPVSMRDLHSPSPTPDHVFADFLSVDNVSKPHNETTAEANLLDMDDTNEIAPVQSVQPPQQILQQNQPPNDPFMSLMEEPAPVVDINQNHSVKRESPPVAKPPRPAPPVKPPPPNLPQIRPSHPPPPIPARTPSPIFGMPAAKTPSPVFGAPAAPSNERTPSPVFSQPSPIISPQTHAPPQPPPPTYKSAPPPKPPQPPKPAEPPRIPQPAEVSAPPPTPVPQPAEAQPPPPPEPVPESNLQDDAFMLDGPAEKPVASTADIMSLYSTTVSKPEPVIDLLCDSNDITLAPAQDTLISPEISQDVNIDTSDTQSKGSGSSATFNPFASEETIVPAVPDSPAKSLSGSLLQEEIVPSQAEALAFPGEGFANNADEFDAFAAKFESAGKDERGSFDPFSGSGAAWGDMNDNVDPIGGFDGDEPFDAFLSMQEPPAVPKGTPAMLSKRESQESDEDKDFSVFIKPKATDVFGGAADSVMPVLAPPPKEVLQNAADANRFNPFDQSEFASAAVDQAAVHPFEGAKMERTDSQETPPTPLFDDDVSQPLEDFPRILYAGEGWEMQLRQPNKKKITGQRFWKKIFVRLVVQDGCTLLQLFNSQTDKDAFQELPLQPCYSVSDIGAQQYDNYGKIFTIKLQYIFYKERPGVRPGQVTKAERITNKLSQFAAYAIQGDYQGVKEFGSDLKKLGLPVEHAPQVSQLLKIGSLNYEDVKQFSVCIEEALFKLSAHRDRALHYKMEEVQITAVDELYVVQNSEGHVEKQIARVRLFFLGFLSGMPDVELGVNDMRRQGKEVVGRHDIIPVVTEEWIRLEAVEFHSCVQQEDYHKTHIIKFKPPDACYIELMRFRIRPPKNRELPLQLKPTICVTGNRIEIKADILVPGFASRKLGQVPCEDVQIRFPIPECWIYLFRVEKHFRYGSVKSAHRRTGKIKGIERFLGTVETLQESLIEVTSGQAKYEHQHRAIVWRIPRLPKEGQGAYTTHNLICKLALTSFDQMPEQLAEWCYVEFTMPATQASHTTVRSVSFQNSQSDEPPEKYVRYLARHEYKVGIEHTEGQEPNAYLTATSVNKPAPVPEEPPAAAATAAAADDDSSSDSD